MQTGEFRQMKVIILTDFFMLRVGPASKVGVVGSTTRIARIEGKRISSLSYSVELTSEEGALPLFYSNKPSRGEGSSPPFLLD